MVESVCGCGWMGHMLLNSAEVTCLSVGLGNLSVITGRILPKSYSDEQKKRANGERRQLMAWGDEQSGAQDRECLFYEQEGIFMVCLEWITLMLGKQTWNSWTTLWISCHNNLIHLSLVSSDPFERCINSLWMFDFQAYSAVNSAVWLCSSDYMEC